MDDLTPDLQEIADLLWEAAQGAPPVEEDKVWWLVNAQAWEDEM
jgi:hypothetical protein